MVNRNSWILNNRQNRHNPNLPGASSPAGTQSLTNWDTSKLKTRAEGMKVHAVKALGHDFASSLDSKCQAGELPAIPAPGSWRQAPWSKLDGRLVEVVRDTVPVVI